MTDERRDKIKRRSPLKRFASIEEACNVVMFLLSTKASGMTGSVITVDAGNSA
jgi:3-oxoacyl-[acyl-carrier protein] reductase